ncbi:class I glutamine amidotransferase-like protein [Aspergillus cavernicola]|uniref:Class I glutamine amidotransferase-like protein n=1 Tax=Aspergillus cavernicola TaxID=176166 RepID=A0ABR4IM96_9EURO
MSTTTTTTTEQPRLRIALLIFPGFQALDAFGPIDCLNVLSLTTPITLSILSQSLDPVSTKSPFASDSLSQEILPTHTFATAPEIDVLLVPGGKGVRCLDTKPITEAIKFIGEVYPSLKYLITVCTGSALVARSGVLDGRRATTNKKVFREAKGWRAEVEWVAKARWVVDGNIWTSSGVSAGIDVILAWMGEVYGKEVAKNIADHIEYERHEDPEDDPFAVLYGLK